MDRRNIMKHFTIFFLIILLSSQFIFSQTWVRKVDGFSMWSIAKDYAGNIYAGTTGSARGIFKSTDGGETWTNMFSTGASNYLGIDCDSLNNVYIANTSNGMLTSTDGGQNFTLIPSSTFNGNTINMVACGRLGYIFAGATNGGIWRSTDFGATFTNTALQSNTIVSIAVDKYDANIIYAGSSSTSVNGFFVSTDGGLTFGPSTNPINVWEIMQKSPNDLFTVTTSSPYPFCHSTDGGLTWDTVSNQPGAMRGATLDLHGDIYISGNGGVFKSTNGGASFINHNLTFSSNKILVFNNKIMVCVAGTANGGIWIFTDNAIPVELTYFTADIVNDQVELNWQTVTETNNRGFEIERSNDKNTFSNIGFIEGKGTTTEKSYYVFNDFQALQGTIYYRLKQLDLDGSFKYSNTVEINYSFPKEFSLSQNYPNPFNPVTNIKYSIPNVTLSGIEGSRVQLKVFNVLGNEIATLVDEYKPAGKYKITWDATNQPSGIYFYQLKAGDYTSVKKMILMK
jgi:photosystem II stability/assembly factor-like uncharacterized protein